MGNYAVDDQSNIKEMIKFNLQFADQSCNKHTYSQIKNPSFLNSVENRVEPTFGNII